METSPERDLAIARDNVAQSPNDPLAYHVLGECLIALNQENAALAVFSKAVKLQGATLKSLYLLSKIQSKLGSFELAIATYKKVPFLRPLNAHVHHHMGTLQFAAGHYQISRIHMRLAVLLKSNDAGFRRSLGEFYSHTGEAAKAVICLTAAVSLEPNNLVLQEILADHLLGCNKWSESKKLVAKLQDHYQKATGFDNKSDALRPLTENQNLGSTDISDWIGLVACSAALHWGMKLCDVEISEKECFCTNTLWPVGNILPGATKAPVPPANNCPNAPLISIIIPVYNVKNKDWLDACISSVLRQDLGADWAEIVVVDDKSGDTNAWDVTKNFTPRVAFRQNKKNLGLVSNFNDCIAKARGEFIHILHQDDLVEPGFYDAILPVLKSNKDLVAGFSDCIYINEAGTSLSQTPKAQPKSGVVKNWHLNLARHQPHQFPAIIVRRSAYCRVGGFSPSLIFSFDWEMWSRLAATGPFWYVVKPLAKYRIHKASATYDISDHDRLLDVMRTVALNVRRLPKECQQDAAQGIFVRIFREYLRSLLNNKSPLTQSNFDQISEIFLSGWCTPDQANEILKNLISEPQH